MRSVTPEQRQDYDDTEIDYQEEKVFSEMSRDQAIDYYFNWHPYESYETEGTRSVQLTGTIQSIGGENDVFLTNEGGDIHLRDSKGVSIIMWGNDEWLENESVCLNILELFDLGEQKGASAVAKKLGKRYNKETGEYERKAK